MAHKLPQAIWMPSPDPTCPPSVYRGSPVEMVERMAEELGAGITILEAIDTLGAALEDNRQVELPVPRGHGPEQLSAWFVAALLASGVSRPLGLTC